MASIRLENITEPDLNFVKEIYDWYALNSTATFHTEPVTIEELKTFIYVGHPRFQSFMIIADDEPIGYCYLTNYKKRQAYDQTAELTIYLKHDCVVKGAGTEALILLEVKARAADFKNLLAIISGDNDRSIYFFEKNGYEKCAHFKKVGQKFGKLLDVVGYQKEI